MRNTEPETKKYCGITVKPRPGVRSAILYGHINRDPSGSRMIGFEEAIWKLIEELCILEDVTLNGFIRACKDRYKAISPRSPTTDAVKSYLINYFAKAAAGGGAVKALPSLKALGAEPRPRTKSGNATWNFSGMHNSSRSRLK